MAVTSQVRADQTVGETFVQNWQDAGLLKPSAIKPVIATIARSLILNKLGQLVLEDRRALMRAMGSIMGSEE